MTVPEVLHYLYNGCFFCGSCVPYCISHKTAEYRCVLGKQYICCTISSWQKFLQVMEASSDLRTNVFCVSTILYKNVLNAYQLYFFFRGRYN